MVETDGRILDSRDRERIIRHALTNVLLRQFYDRDPVVVAPALLGKLLVRDDQGRVTAGLIVETEAYLARVDAANHAYGKISRGRVATMFGPPGHAYVYMVYGMHHCMNLVTEKAGVASAVLLRALQPVLGVEVMQQRRKNAPLTALARGPGNLSRAMAIDRWQHDRCDMTTGVKLWIAALEEEPRFDIACSPRVGVRAAHELLLRFFVSGNPCVSRGPAAVRECPRRR